jgi:putative transposase
MPTDHTLPDRKHLRRLERVLDQGHAPLFFITVCVAGRAPILANPAAHGILLAAWRHYQPSLGWLIGRYVVMPDHAHFFASRPNEGAKNLSSFVGLWKRSTAIRIRAGVEQSFAWQPEFFDHLLRSSESYEQKWEYVQENPAREGLVDRAADWLFQGELNALTW